MIRGYVKYKIPSKSLININSNNFFIAPLNHCTMENSPDGSNEVSKQAHEEKDETLEIPFKKPVLIGKIGRLPRKISQQNKSEEGTKSDMGCQPKQSNREDGGKESKQVIDSKEISDTSDIEKHIRSPAQVGVKEVPLSYNEPEWGGMPTSMESDYVLEVLKEGSIIETINLMNKSFWVFGRLNTCHIAMQHPTISRYHAVLQYRIGGTDTESSGFYIYDLGSTHGTYLNKNRLKPRVYVRVQVGHMLKLGCSTRTYILNGPEYDEEEESELTVTELKQKRNEQILKWEADKLKREEEKEEQMRKEEERGIDWGLGEDADEETDLSINPYAQTANEELYIADPKKCLRGFFEREGLELTYDCQERGMGQFQCRVELPLDDEIGRPVVAEVIHKGKKKEAVIQCALEACRILDSHGVLRQATHESRKRKAKNWEENDYYDSDEDIFLDRTGTIEKKRERRMKAKAPQKAETYESLLEKEKSLASSIAGIEKKLSSEQTTFPAKSLQPQEEDSLDTFMKELSTDKPSKLLVNKLKRELLTLKAEHAKIIRLVNIAKPAELPPLVAKYDEVSKGLKSKIMPVIGKRKKIKMHLPVKSNKEYVINDLDDEEEDEEKEQQSDKQSFETVKNAYKTVNQQNNILEKYNEDVYEDSEQQEGIKPGKPKDYNSSSDSDDDKNPSISIRKLESMLKKGLPPFAAKSRPILESIIKTFNILINYETQIDKEILVVKKRKVLKLLSDMNLTKSNEKMAQDVNLQLTNILNNLKSMCRSESSIKSPETVRIIVDAVKKVPTNARQSHAAKQAEYDDSSDDEGTSSEKRKKKNVRRIQQRQAKAEQEKQKGYEEDATKEDYSMWLPPSGQSGDGRTYLNDKFGY